MNRLFHLMGRYKKESILAPLFKMLEALLELFVPLVVADIIDQGIYADDKTHIIVMSIVLLVLALIGLFFSITAQYFAARSAVGTAAVLRSQLFSHIQTFGYEEMDKTGTATLITRMTSDVNQVQNAVNMVLRLLLRSPFIVFGAMIMAFTIDFSAAMIFVVVIPLLSVVVFGVMIVTRPIYRNVQKALDKILGMTRENLTGIRVIRAFHREEHELESFVDANEELTGLQKLAGRLSGLTNPLTFAIINYAIIILIYTGALRVNSGSLSQGQVVALYNYMSQILVELIKLSNLIVLITRGLACMSRIDALFEVRPAMAEGEGASGEALETGGTKEDRESDGIKENRKNGGYLPGHAAVEFSDVSFRYESGGGDALSHISFRAEKGQTIGIIGGTGSGKTTLVNLIPRFYDAGAGHIHLFGEDIRKYSFGQLREMVSVVPQKAQLFEGTIRSNLLMGCPDATEEEIMDALRISQAKEFVDQKEGGLDAVIEQGGRNLSGGQRQRLTLARALMRRAEILIMDDSASALDYATDARLRRAISQMERQMTVFIVSQRASSILNADQILVLDDGELVGLGSHEALLKACPLYREIYYTQYRNEEA